MTSRLEADRTGYRDLSLWHETLDEPLVPRPPLTGDADVDVAIVGAGFTGLWTAYYLALADQRLRIAVFEREISGFGASGRNGGWCSALFPASLRRLARLAGPVRATAMYRALQDTVDEVGRVTLEEGIDCGYSKGGTITVARTGGQLERARATVTEAREFGFGEDDLVLLDAADAHRECAAAGVLGGTYTPHCAAVHPARLVRGLARAVASHGVRIYERTPVLDITPGSVPSLRTPYGTVRAEAVVRATEGYTPTLPGQRRLLAPVYSLMLATTPLPRSFWNQVGLHRRQTFSDFRHLIVYGQRTEDDRLAFGGRGAPYHFGSRVRPEYDRRPAVFDKLHESLRELFPALSDVDHEVSHTWGGPLGVPRDWCPSVGFDREQGVGYAGGYVGDGVAASNLAGRTLTDLILGHRNGLVHLPWVDHRSPRWEPEPLRWLGVNVARRAVTAADRFERRTGRESRLAPLVSRLVGD
jgi:glycine/D-amino acid oxidase-like deaminating enzyme